jgi:hypothetical protein
VSWFLGLINMSSELAPGPEVEEHRRSLRGLTRGDRLNCLRTFFGPDLTIGEVEEVAETRESDLQPRTEDNIAEFRWCSGPTRNNRFPGESKRFHLAAVSEAFCGETPSFGDPIRIPNRFKVTEGILDSYPSPMHFDLGPDGARIVVAGKILPRQPNPRGQIEEILDPESTSRTTLESLKPQEWSPQTRTGARIIDFRVCSGPTRNNEPSVHALRLEHRLGMAAFEAEFLWFTYFP